MEEVEKWAMVGRLISTNASIGDIEKMPWRLNVLFKKLKMEMSIFDLSQAKKYKKGRKLYGK